MKLYLISAPVILISLLMIDSIWLTVMSPRFYKPLMSHFMMDTIKLTPAIIFYVMYAISISILIVIPAIDAGYSPLKVFLFGALFGLTAYGAYDLVNHATIKGWPMILTVVDMAWGATLTGVVTFIGFKAAKMFG